jgi:MFS family permease
MMRNVEMTPGLTRRGWTLVLASFGSFLAALDVVVVASALPTLRTHLGASLSDLEWTINAYNLVFACLMLTGAGAAVVLPLTLTLISDAFPVEKRGTAIGMWGGITGLGVAAGPVVGGAVVQGISWQWIFWINVPVGLLVAVLSALRLQESRGPRPQPDIVGLVLVGMGMFALTWAPVRAPSSGWDSARSSVRSRWGRCLWPPS